MAKAKLEFRRNSVDTVADALRALSIEHGEGEFFGSENGLAARFGVSRPTLRQATSLVAAEQLIEIRRGPGGGYFARRPGSGSVSRVAAIYLQSRQAYFAEIMAVMRPLRIEQAKAAARNADPAIREELAAFIAADARWMASGRSVDMPADYVIMLERERALHAILGRMAANEVLRLVLSVLFDLTAQIPKARHVVRDRPERIAAWRVGRVRVVNAILEGDDDYAGLLIGRTTDLIIEWIAMDDGGDGRA